MGLFSPYKRHANRFNYIPRYFDPAKEQREQRRAELRGERSDDQSEYMPGKYIRTQREARAAKREGDKTRQGCSIWKPILGAALILLFVVMLFPRLVGAFSKAKQAHATEQLEYKPREATSALDQSGISDVEWQAQPITVVPNDYTE